MRTITLMGVFMVLCTISLGAQSLSDFVTTWKVTASNDSITIPTYGSGYNYDVEWGDGTIETDFTGDATHVYSSPGVYTVRISGDFPQIYFNLSGDRFKIQSIEQWGDYTWRSMTAAFAGCENLVSNATDMPDLSAVTDMSGMFAYCRKFNGDANIGNWDVSNVVNMYSLFGGTSVFNKNIDSWNVGNVQNMSFMFDGATKYNQPLNSWDVGNVQNMQQMFWTALRFNQDLGSWDVSNVTNFKGTFGYTRRFNGDVSGWNVSSATDMRGMFGGSSVFNRDISQWDVSNVQDFSDMFNGATKFNQDLSMWNTGNAINMRKMFRTAMAFNQDLSAWNVGNCTNMREMFAHANRFDQNLENWQVQNLIDAMHMFKSISLSTNNYDSLLNGWSSLPLKNNVRFSAGNSKYCGGEMGRNYMITAHGWVITDGGLDCEDIPLRPGGAPDLSSEVSFYPNPMTTSLNIANTFNGKYYSASIYDLSGRLIKTVNLDSDAYETSIDVSNLKQATYLVVIDGKEGQTSKLVVKQ